MLDHMNKAERVIQGKIRKVDREEPSKDESEVSKFVHWRPEMDMENMREFSQRRINSDVLAKGRIKRVIGRVKREVRMVGNGNIRGKAKKIYL